MSSTLRRIPSIERLRQEGRARALEAAYGRDATVRALREAADDLRRRIVAGEAALGDTDEATASILDHVDTRLRRTWAPSLRPVINATGVIVHTNLGRAPLSAAAIDRVAAVARGYSNLEYDLDAGRRGSRAVHAASLLCRLTGAEAAVVVNNNAAAVLIVLAALAAGREVIVSRGEQVEIGGGFRIPDVMRQSGAILREVGTTNRTRIADYGAALGARTGLILRVHRSNFTVSGFTEQPSRAELAALGRRFDVPVVEDLGSGLLGAVDGLREPTVTDILDAGVDLCTFSGDKLLGGPQAGLIVGRRAVVTPIGHHPLMRAVRVDKLVLAALEATLVAHATAQAGATVPVTRMIGTSVETLEARAGALAARLAGHPALTVTVEPTNATVGGGSTPGLTLPSRALAVEVAARTTSGIEAALRAGDPPVIGRIDHGRLLLDLLTVAPDADAILADALVRLAVSGPPGSSGADRPRS